MRKKIIVGIDEVGRGPLAGPVMVGIVVSHGHIPLAGIHDSKRMTEAARERVYSALEELQAEGRVRFGVYAESAEVIDTLGIQVAIARAVARGLRDLEIKPADAEIALDAGLHAPQEYEQQSIIHGDALVPAIALAAIAAKVTRDREMVSTVAPLYPVYGFESHKGYGTRAHLEALARHGSSPVHRKSFLTKLVLG